ncbi:uncharacterized protein [Physcomitrium patens]|uniref:uncharacterized protein isoform X3 n=1 Tax=Physcomitrium patens TaxID=3218 RepID=UPI003CCE479F
MCEGRSSSFHERERCMKRTNLCSMRIEVIRNALLERQTWFMVWFRMIGILKSTEKNAWSLQMAAADYSKTDHSKFVFSEADYLDLSIKSIHGGNCLVHGGTLELFENLCKYLVEELAKTKNFLESRSKELSKLHDVCDRRRVALLQLYLVIKQAEDLLQKCCESQESAWPERALTLLGIREEILDILLHLWWWEAILDYVWIISTTSASYSQMREVEVEHLKREVELEHVKLANQAFETMLAHLSSRGSKLQEAADKDREHLLNKLLELQTACTGRSEESHADLLSLQVLSLLKEDEDVSRNNPKLNEYTCKAAIGLGCFGQVLQVMWCGYDCAVKIIDNPDDRCESDNLGRFHHPHIVQFYRHWKTGPSSNPDLPPRSHMLMERMPSDLAEHIRRLKERKVSFCGNIEDFTDNSERTPVLPFSITVTIDIMLQVAKAMWQMHSQGVVHRDLKPGNVLVRQVRVPELASLGFLEVKLGDFGLSRENMVSSHPNVLTENVGSSLYRAPELSFKEYVRGGKNYPFKGDVWSFGIMFAEILSGKIPYGEFMRLGDLKDKLMNGARPWIPEHCPDYLKFCIQSCWDYDPKKRATFSDIWGMLRVAKLRSLGILQQNYDLFAFEDHKGDTRILTTNPTNGTALPELPETSLVPQVVSRAVAMADYSQVDYYREALSSIMLVQNLVNGQQVQINSHQCQYLSAQFADTKNLLKAKAVRLRSISNCDDIRRKALLKMCFTMKRAEKLVRNCCCELETWLESAVTLAHIMDDIVDILLDLRWWTSMVDIAVASVTCLSSDQQVELGLLRDAEAQLERLFKELHLPNNVLEGAAIEDKEQLLRRVRDLQNSYAGTNLDDQQNLEYLVAGHVRSRLEDTENATMIDLDLNAYEEGKFLGIGGFGTVMNVKWLGRRCALKTLNHVSKKEAAFLKVCQHPHVVQFLRYWEAPFGSKSHRVSQADECMQSQILTELLPTDLFKHLKLVAELKETSQESKSMFGSWWRPQSTSESPITDDVVIDVMLQIAKAMCHLPNKDVAHMNLNPHTVLVRAVSMDEIPELNSRGHLHVKLAGFSVAMRSSDELPFNVGSKVYGAPEVFIKEGFSKETSPSKADVWSFGITFSEILNGRPPFQLSKDLMLGELQGKIRKGLRPTLPENCPDYLKWCIANCWDQRPEDRPNFTDLLKILRLAQVRSLGIVSDNYDLFTYRTRDGMRTLPPSKKTPASVRALGLNPLEGSENTSSFSLDHPGSSSLESKNKQLVNF